MAEKRSVGSKTIKPTKSLASESTSIAESELPIPSAPTLNFLPSPEDLAKYEKIVPGGAAHLLEIAEQGITHERELRRKTLDVTTRLKTFSAVAKFILGLAAGLLGGILLINGNELAGLIIILVDAAALVATTLYRRTSAEE